MNYDEFLRHLATEQTAEVDANKLELTLRALVRGDESAVARTRRHPRGIELFVTVDGDLHVAASFAAASYSSLRDSTRN